MEHFVLLVCCGGDNKKIWNLPDFFLEDRLVPPPRLISRRPVSIFVKKNTHTQEEEEERDFTSTNISAKQKRHTLWFNKPKKERKVKRGLLKRERKGSFLVSLEESGSLRVQKKVRIFFKTYNP